MHLPPPSPKQVRILWLALTGLAIAVLVGLIVCLVWGIGKVVQIMSPVLWPLAVAGVLAYLLDPIVDYLERRGWRRTRAILGVFFIAFLVVATLLASVIPQIVVQTRELASNAPEYATQLQKRLADLVENSALQRFVESASPRPRLTPLPETVTVTNEQGEVVMQVLTNTPAPASSNAAATTQTNSPSLLAFGPETIQSATSLIPKAGKWLAGQATRVASWFGVLIGLALVPIYAFYLLLEKRGIEASWTHYLPLADSKLKEELVFILRSINEYLIAFFRGQVLVAICDAVLYTVGFLIIGLPYAVLLGFAAIFLTLIPFLGAIVLCVAAVIIALVQFGDWLHPVYVLAVFAVVQSLEGVVIAPKIMGDRVGLHPLTIIIAVMVGTTLLGGLLGGILAIPLTAVLRVLMGRYIWKKQQAGL